MDEPSITPFRSPLRNSPQHPRLFLLPIRTVANATEGSRVTGYSLVLVSVEFQSRGLPHSHYTIIGRLHVISWLSPLFTTTSIRRQKAAEDPRSHIFISPIISTQILLFVVYLQPENSWWRQSRKSNIVFCFLHLRLRLKPHTVSYVIQMHQCLSYLEKWITTDESVKVHR